MVSSYLRRYHRERRLAADLKRMAAEHPGLVLSEDPATRLEALEGPLALEASRSGIVRHVPVRIVFPEAYPFEEPRAFDFDDRFLPHHPDRHFYSDGMCCIWLPWASEWRRTDPGALLDFMARLIVFLNHQLIFDVSRKWPVAFWGHGRDGYRQYLVEQLQIADADLAKFTELLTDGRRVAYLPCPCGSGKKARFCHLAVVDELASKIGRTRLKERVLWINEPVQPSVDTQKRQLVDTAKPSIN